VDTTGKRKSDHFEDAGIDSARNTPQWWVFGQLFDAQGFQMEAGDVYRGNSRILAWAYTQRMRSHGYTVTVYLKPVGSLTFREYASYEPFSFSRID
jgi:hypothetical protein